MLNTEPGNWHTPQSLVVLHRRKVYTNRGKKKKFRYHSILLLLLLPFIVIICYIHLSQMTS